MFTKTKIGIILFAVLSFIVGGLAFSAYQADAFGRGGFGFGKMFKGDKPEITEEMKAQMEERKAVMQAQREEWQNMTAEERQAKMEEMNADRPAKRDFGFMGMRGMPGISQDEINHEVVNIENGVQITITSDNADVVQKIQEMASRMSE